MDEHRDSNETPTAADATSVRGKVSRRGLLAKGAAVAAGGVGLAAVVAAPAEASTGTMIYGTEMNAGVDETRLLSNSDDQTLFVSNLDIGTGMYASSVNGWGINAYGGLDAVMAFGNRYGLFATGLTAPLFLQPAFAVLGPPTSGIHARGEIFVDSLGRHYLCVGDGNPGTWVRPGLNPITPYRVCDTRSGTATPYSNGVKLGAGSNLLIQIAGEAGVPVPEGATAIIANLTVTGGTAASSYLTAYPANLGSPPTASNINFTAGQTIANQITVALDPSGNIRIFNKYGSVHVIVDLAGFAF